MLQDPMGKIIISGAGTSGRLAIHASVTHEPSRVVGLMAGGLGAFYRAKERVEDQSSGGIEDLVEVRRGSVFDEATADAALQSVGTPVNNDDWAEWIATFFRTRLA